MYVIAIYLTAPGLCCGTWGLLLSLWHEARNHGLSNPDDAKLPDADALAAAAEHCSFDNIVIDEENHITLTETGLEIAEKIYNRHIVLSKMLMALGVPEDIAAEDACRMEHTISDESFEAIRRHVERI